MIVGILLLGAVALVVVLVIACLPLVKWIFVGVLVLGVYLIGVDRVEGWLQSASDALEPAPHVFVHTPLPPRTPRKLTPYHGRKERKLTPYRAPTDLETL